MSCWRKTTVLRIPAAALGFVYLREWNAFLQEHEEDFDWEEGYFAESLSDDYPMIYGWYRSLDRYDPDRRLDLRDPEHPDVVPGPFLDYCLEEIIPLQPEDNTHGEGNTALELEEYEKEEYLPIFQELFPDFTLKDMDAVRWCRYEWYDGSNAPYYYTDLDEVD